MEYIKMEITFINKMHFSYIYLYLFFNSSVNNIFIKYKSNNII